jgi:hypothetical protein
MIDITSQDLTVVSGAGDVNWVQVGRDVATTGAAIAGGAFGAGIGGPVGAAVIGTAAVAGVGALYDKAGKPASIPSEAWNVKAGRECYFDPNNLNDICH